MGIYHTLRLQVCGIKKQRKKICSSPLLKKEGLYLSARLGYGVSHTQHTFRVCGSFAVTKTESTAASL